MPVKITNIALANPFRTEKVDRKLGNVMDDEVWEISLSVQTYTVSSTSSPFTINAVNGFVGTGWVFDPSGGFANFIIGDTIVYYDKGVIGGNQQTFTIIDKLDGGRIRLSGLIINPVLAPYAPDTPANNSIFSVSTPITALKYQCNSIENSEPNNFNSKVSGTEHELVIKTISAAAITVLPMEFLGEKSYQTGSATANGVSAGVIDGVYTSKFKIIHTTQTNPLFLSKQWADTLSGIAPPYFSGLKCLKQIFSIQACTDYTNPNWIQQVSVFETLGNTGWLGENFNTGLTKYSIDGLIIKDSGGAAQTAIPLNADHATIEFRIKNITDSPFSNNNTKFQLGIIKAAFNQSEYQLNGRNIDANFANDRALQTVGSPAVNGNKFGVSGQQVLTNIVGTFISTSEIKITATVVMPAATLALMAESVEPRYILHVAVANHTLETKKSDLVRLPVHVSPFFVDKTSPGLVEFDHLYLKHWEGGANGDDPDMVGEGFSDIPVFPEDEVTSNTLFFLNKTNYLTDAISIQSIVVRIKAKNTVTNEEQSLDAYPYSFTGLPFINGNQYISLAVPRIFHIPAAEIRKTIHITRRTDLDTTNRYAYQVIFPWLNRWEYWEVVAGTVTTGRLGDWYDTALPLIGYGHDWYRISQLPNWGIFYELNVIGLRNGYPFSEIFENRLTQYDYDNNPDWTPNTLKSYDKDTAVQLFGSGKNWLQANKPSRVEAAFTKVSALPDLSRTVVNMKIEAFEVGGVAGSRRMSSKWKSDTDTWFKSLDASQKTILTLGTENVANDTVLANVLIDPTKLPAGTTIFSIASRLYEAAYSPHCICPDGWTADLERMVCFRPSISGGGSKIATKWVFGNSAALDFDNLNGNGDPTFFLGTQMITHESAASIADDAGNLLFYSMGVFLYRGDNTLVCSDLLGNRYGNVFIMRFAPDVYYLFTADETRNQGNHTCTGTQPGSYCTPSPGAGQGIRYTILRDVTPTTMTINPLEKNVVLYNTISAGAGEPPTENVLVRKDVASGNFFVILRENITAGNTNFKVFMIDPAGVFTGPTTYPAIRPCVNDNSGILKISSNGKFIAKAVRGGAGGFELYNYDETTGAITGGIFVATTPTVCEGFEFSPDCTKVYIANQLGAGKIYQYDISSFIAATITASETDVYTAAVGVAPSYLQLGPNGRIYCALLQLSATNGLNYIAVIRSPDVAGVGCDVQANVPLNGAAPGSYALGLGSNTSLEALPNVASELVLGREEMSCGERPPDIALLKEDGDLILLESGGKIILA